MLTEIDGSNDLQEFTLNNTYVFPTNPIQILNNIIVFGLSFLVQIYLIEIWILF